jgi:hypothetical protein
MKLFHLGLWVQKVLEVITIIMGHTPSVRDMNGIGKVVERFYLTHKDKAERERERERERGEVKCCGVFYPQILLTVTYFF